MSECKCKKPVLQKNTRQCGHCKFYINRVRHILMIAERVLKIYPKFVVPGSILIKLLLLSIGLLIFEPINGSVIYNPPKEIKSIKRLHKKKKRHRFRVKRKINNMSSSVLFWFLFLLTIVFMLLIFGFLMGLKIPVWGMTLYLMFCLLVILFFIVLGLVWLADKISRMKR